MLCLHWHHNQTHSEYEKPANNDMHAIISAVKSHGKNSAKLWQISGGGKSWQTVAFDTHSYLLPLTSLFLCTVNANNKTDIKQSHAMPLHPST